MRSMDGRVEFKMGCLYAKARQYRYDIEEPMYLQMLSYILCVIPSQNSPQVFAQSSPVPINTS